MKKLLLILLCLIVCTGTLSGCNKTKNDTPKKESGIVDTAEYTAEPDQTKELVSDTAEITTEDTHPEETEPVSDSEVTTDDTHTEDTEPVSDNDNASLISLRNEYTELLQSSWKLPEKLDLINTAWDASYILSDGSTAACHSGFAADGVYLKWGDDDLTLPWSIVTEDGICKLKLNEGTDEEKSYCILLSTQHDFIYISQDFTSDTYKRDEPMSIMLERTYG